MIEANGGAKSTGGISENAINDIAEKNPKKKIYIEVAERAIGK